MDAPSPAVQLTSIMFFLNHAATSTGRGVDHADECSSTYSFPDRDGINGLIADLGVQYHITGDEPTRMPACALVTAQWTTYRD